MNQEIQIYLLVKCIKPTLNFIILIYVLMLQYLLFIATMRSMRTDDIPGAVPANRQFDKSKYRYLHEEEVKKFSRPQLAQSGDVYLASRSQLINDGLPIFPRKLRGYSSTLKYKDQLNPELKNQNTQNKNINMSQSMPMNLVESNPSKVLSGKEQSQTLNRGGLFMNSGSMILSSSGVKQLKSPIKGVDNSPYFPQLYRDYDENKYQNKWSGNRGWNDSATLSVVIPKKGLEYYPKWS